MAIGAFSRNQEVAVVVAPMVLIFLMILSGFFINGDSIPVYWIWVCTTASNELIFVGVLHFLHQVVNLLSP